MAALITEIESCAHKVIVFIPWRHAIEGIGGVFDRLREVGKVSFDHCIIHGDTKNREDYFNTFQNTDQLKVMLAHPKTVHHGITLARADTVVWYSPTESFDIYDQANARVIRAGQKHKQHILHMVATPEEKKVYASLRAKDNLQDKLLELLEIQTEEKSV
jgi:SNF2 family DNA or RNA helicase